MKIKYIKKLIHHNKASELYAVTEILSEENTITNNIYIPIHYRRTGVYIDENSDQAIEDYLQKLSEEITRNYPFTNWMKSIVEQYIDKHPKSTETLSLLQRLQPLQKICIIHNYKNSNWARRCQALKEYGLTIATYTHENCDQCKTKTTQIMLLPIDIPLCTVGNGYEIISPQLQKRIKQALKSVDQYELSVRSSGLLPDHKFPEIRWGSDTKTLNINTMTNEEITTKFQLINNQRNQQKREQCRICYQTNKRGKMFGINYYYLGNENWDHSIPKTGRIAENGCIGCPWYDIKAWRDSLNEFIAQYINKK